MVMTIDFRVTFSSSKTKRNGVSYITSFKKKRGGIGDKPMQKMEPIDKCMTYISTNGYVPQAMTITKSCSNP